MAGTAMGISPLTSAVIESLRNAKEKYGRDVTPEKARQYFDKIIQVPFAMPVGS